MTESPNPSKTNPLAVLAGGGEMGERIRSYDWSKTPVGAVAEWQHGLRSAVRIMLNSRYPMFVWWGPELTNFYNDAYIPILGLRHPLALGSSAAEVWSEIWHVIGPQAQAALTEGRASWSEEQLLLMERNGFTEETYFTYSYGPIYDDEGQIKGMLCACTEETSRVLGQRRLRTLRSLADRTSEARTVEDACESAISALADNRNDIPFLLLYLLDDNGDEARLAGANGLKPVAAGSPSIERLDDEASWWPLREAAQSGKSIELTDLPARFNSFGNGDWPKDLSRALVIPIARPGTERPAGFVVAGISPRLVFNDDYRGFLELLTGKIGTAIANARAYEEERRRMQALAELNSAKTIFFSNVSHEFRTPLTLMLGPLDDAISEMSDRRQHERLQLVRRNATRLQKLVNSLLDFSRIEAGRVRGRFTPVDLAAFTAELTSNFRSACDKAELTIEADCPPLPEPVYVDAEMWEKIILNLLSNAFKYTLKGGIVVSLRAVDRHAELRVADTGVGIPADQVSGLFERFHRVKGVTGRSQEGSGIGLALVRELIRLHGGEIRVESIEGQGTTFTVMIPFGASHLPANQVEQTAGQVSASLAAPQYVQEAIRWLPGDVFDDQTPGMIVPESEGTLLKEQAGDESGEVQPARVLVVDDNADMRLYLSRLLSDHFQVRLAEDGEAALEALRAWPPDVVLTDVMMPRLDGFGLLRALRADPEIREIPVIMLSARAGEESRIEGKVAGADDYLVKPFSARELIACVTSQVQMARLRRLANDSLRESEARFRALVNAGSEAVYRMNADWSELRYVHGRDFVRDTDEPIAGWLEAYIPPEDQEQVMEVVQTAIESREAFELEHRVRRLDGTIGWSHSRAIPQLNQKGELVEWFGMASDVTARKEAEELLRASEERLRGIFEQTAAGIAQVDHFGRFVLVNQRFCELTGYSAEELRSLSCEEITHPEDLSLGSSALQEAREDQQSGTVEKRYVRKDGSMIWVRNSISNFSPRLGQPPHRLVVSIDITERKQAEQRQAEAREFLHSSIDALSSHIAVLDENGVILAVNNAWRRFADENQYSGKNYGIGASYLHACEGKGECVDEEMVTGLRGVLEGWQEFFEYEYPCHSPTSHRWFVMRVTRFQSPDPVRVVVAHENVTKRRLAEEALREADRRKDEFLATLAHELRNPLAPIRNGLQIMRLAKGDQATIEQAHTMMERQLRQMVHLVDDLLDLSRISRGKIELRKERVELARIVQHAVETSRPVIDSNDHELIIEAPQRAIYVDADVTRMAQVFSNLLNNAAKYTQRGGRIWLTVERDGQSALVAVRDNGVGLPANMLPKVFDIFTQVDRTLERSQGGLGIGLSIVKRLVEMHGGTVTAQSEGNGLGSEFTVRLPVALSIVESQAEDDFATPPSNRRRILVVDDNRDAATSLAMVLKIMGNDARTAHSGLEAIDVAGKFRPDLILLDIGMPGLNGYETARRIRDQPWGRNVVIVALTGWGQEEDRRKAQEAGFNSHIVKPVEPTVLDKLLSGLQADTG